MKVEEIKIEGRDMEVVLDDLTVASMLSVYLSNDERVEVSSFRETHPLEGRVILFLRVKEGSDPKKVLSEVIDKALADIKELREGMTKALE